ncbi:hypothetical protein Tco_0148982 [Tanacetum coccineum]
MIFDLEEGIRRDLQLDEFDLEEIDLKWQVAMISMRMKKFYKKTGRKLQFDAKEPIGFDKTKVEYYSCHQAGHFVRECRSNGNQDSRRRDAWNTRNKDKENGRRSEDEQRTMLSWLAAVQAQTQSNFYFVQKNMSARDKAGLGEETHESMPEPVVNEPKVVSQPKVWSNAPIIEEYESDSEDEHLSCLLKEQLLEPALNLTVHCCGLEFRVLNGYDQKSFDEERGLN